MLLKKQLKFEMNMKIYLATLPNGFFGSAGESWKSLDIQRVADKLNFPVELVSITDLSSISFQPSDVVIYTSSDEENIRFYLKDLMYFLNKKCTIIPNYEILLAHENKGCQELVKIEKKIGNLSGNFFFDLDEAKLNLPKVLKTIDGAGSSGVFLIKNLSDLSKIKSKYFDVSIKRKIIKAQRKFNLQEHEYQIYAYRHKGFSLFVEQEFIPNLTNDYKVLVFGNRFYVLQRSVRKNDFRASGSGLFDFVKPSVEVLNFAKEIFDNLDNPYLSLDIAQSTQGCHLIEFQGTNFGPYTLRNAPNRYISQNNEWIEEKNDGDLEENFIYALNLFLGKQDA